LVRRPGKRLATLDVAEASGGCAVSVQTETLLCALRRRQFGGIADAARALGISRWTLRRAENGYVGAPTRKLLETAFDMSWETLTRDWLSVVMGAIGESA